MMDVVDSAAKDALVLIPFKDNPVSLHQNFDTDLRLKMEFSSNLDWYDNPP